jgi:hypothetical protein
VAAVAAVAAVAVVAVGSLVFFRIRAVEEAGEVAGTELHNRAASSRTDLKS